MSNVLHDMSTTCGNGCDTKWAEYQAGLITSEEFDRWYSEHCAQCKYMHETCMYGEE